MKKVNRIQITSGQALTYTRANAGFTLVELLVVVLIIGILAAVAIPQYQKSVDKARMVQLVTFSSNVLQAQNRYYMENDKWASKWSELDIDLTGYTATNNMLEKTPGDRNWFYADLNSNDKDALYFYGGNKYLPGILFITWYSRDFQSCYADKDNTRAQTLCKMVCHSNYLATDGPWQFCTF